MEKVEPTVPQLSTTDNLQPKPPITTMGMPLERRPSERGMLFPNEIVWRNLHPWLASCGYMLRPRYRHDWLPSWKAAKKSYLDVEDGQISTSTRVMDAVRISDGAFVLLKKIQKSAHPYEVEIGQFLSSEPLASDPKNHCVPIYDVLQVPEEEDVMILVMPLLRTFDDPRFETFGELLEFFRQVFEGLQFMHQQHVAHRDCMYSNIMMDATPLYPKPYHPVSNDSKRDMTGQAGHLTRTQRPVKYYLTDFGISRRYKPEDGHPLEYPIRGGDKSVPEFGKSLEPCDPFPTDIYYIGNMIRQRFLVGTGTSSRKLGLGFMKSLVDDMVQDDPAARPTMDEVVERFEAIYKSLSKWKLRERLIDVDENPLEKIYRAVGYWKRRILFVVTRKPAMPRPRS